MCSKVPDNFSIKAFCISCSTKLFKRRKSKIEFRRADVNILSGMDSSVIGRKFAGSFGSPFLCAKTVQAFLFL